MEHLSFYNLHAQFTCWSFGAVFRFAFSDTFIDIFGIQLAAPEAVDAAIQALSEYKVAKFLRGRRRWKWLGEVEAQIKYGINVRDGATSHRFQHRTSDTLFHRFIG